MEKTQTHDAGSGLIVPINIEALCVGIQTDANFCPPPYNFAWLPNRGDGRAFLAEKAKTGGLVTLETGVHLHWALPDGLTKGEQNQDATGSIRFPAVPDRWLITRVCNRLPGQDKPVQLVKSWVVESNYMSKEMADHKRPSIAVPYRTDDASEQQYRYLGRVLEYETWLQNLKGNNSSDPGTYVSGLTAVGYGTPDFSASYQNCRSLFGFCDTAADLDQLSEADGDFVLSYHVVGWYHDPASDPLTQLPLQMYPADLTALLRKITEEENQDLVKEFYTLPHPDSTYALDPDITNDQRLALRQIFIEAGYDFLGAVLTRCKWSLPSGTLSNQPEVTHTLLTGQIAGVAFNHTTSIVKNKTDVNVAVGNTAYEALAALIASMPANKDLPNVEFLLNALQLGELNTIKDPTRLNAVEKLQLAMHTAAFQPSDGGYIWQISLKDKDDQHNAEVILDDKLAGAVNALNVLQEKYDRAERHIASMRQQIFKDWYRYMLVLYPESDPSGGSIKIDMQPGDIKEMIQHEIDQLNAELENHTTKAIDDAIAVIKLPDTYILERVSAPRFWQPAEPVVLFQGKDIDPPQRYGGDGRFMADDTLLCRLSTQLVTMVTIPPNTLDNTSPKKFGDGNTPKLAANLPLDFGEDIHGLFTEFCLLNPQVLAAELKIGLASVADFNTLATKITWARNGFSEPLVRPSIPATVFQKMQDTLAKTDSSFITSLYERNDVDYELRVPAEQLSDEDRLRLTYIFVSTSQGWSSDLLFSGLAPSLVYFVDWSGNPWLPLSLSWRINYYPYAPVRSNQYDEGFISGKFALRDADLKPTGKVAVPTDFQSYSNHIFLSPHASENFRVQIEKFIDTHHGDGLTPELKEILNNMKDFPPVLSQALNGLHSAMIMRNETLQLDVKDTAGSNRVASFTNKAVRDAVVNKNETAPAPMNYYNPIRAGVMRITSLTIVDVFGRNISITLPNKTILAESLQLDGLPANYAFLPPRFVQPSRLNVRWLSAGSDDIEMNTHPATTPICGWLVANNLEQGLWIYTNNCQALGSILLMEDEENVVWQSAPGQGEFDTSIVNFFSKGAGKDVNKELKNLVLALYNNGVGSYLKAFLHANDYTSSTIQPENYSQLGSTAVLMGSPIAVARMEIGIELKGLPAYNQSWEAMTKEVNDSAPKSDNGFTHVKVPVRLGALEQVNDGLLGYFKDSNYGRYYALGTDKPTDKVKVALDTDITVSPNEDSTSNIVTVLLDPRGSVHARCGMLPVKEIFIPPDMFANDLLNLEMTFLTTPVLTNSTQLAFPTPREGNGHWLWIEHESSDTWSTPEKISPVDDRANLPDPPLVVKEGWMKLNFTDK